MISETQALVFTSYKKESALQADGYVDPRATIVRKVFRHAEAYPRLDFFAAQRAILDGRTICVFERQHRGRVGHFQFSHYESDEGHEQGLMHGLWETFPDDHLLGSSQQVAFRIRPSDNGHNYALCSRCQQRKAKLVFVRTWMCRQCHKLLLRSQLVLPSARKGEQALAIEERLRRGRPKGMHNQTYVAQVEKAKGLRADCGPPQFTKNLFIAAEHKRIVEARWITPAQDVDWEWEQTRRGLPYLD